MNVYEKLQQARVKLQESSLKKSGKNTFSNYDYFELGDFIPQINKIMEEIKLCSFVNFTSEIATLTIVNSEKAEEQIVFSSPMASASLKGCHDVQNLGAVQTYIRRYLYTNAFEIVECDALDRTTGKDKPTELKPEGKALKNNVTDFKSNVEGVKCCDCGKEMTSAEATYSQRFYLANLCQACQKKHKKVEVAK